MIAIDFHVHSSVSKDSNLSPKIIPYYLRKLGYHAAGIVDHNSNKGALIARKYAPKKFLVLVGQEIKTPQGEIMIFGSEKVLKGSMYEIIEKSRDENFLTVLPHPFDFIRNNSIIRKVEKKDIKKLIKKVDAIEAFNLRSFLNVSNSHAKFFAKKMKKPFVAGSDAHTLGELGKVKTLLYSSLNESHIFEAVRKNEIKIFGGKSSFLIHGKSFLIRLEKIFFRKIF